MSLEEQKQWILKQPIVAESRFEGDQFMIVDVPEYDFEDDETEDCIAMTLEDFNSLFIELDVDAIRKQITEILNNGFGDSTHFIESNNLCVDRILEVTLGRKQ